MNIFDEFIGIIKHIDREKIRYALVGGILRLIPTYCPWFYTSGYKSEVFAFLQMNHYWMTPAIFLKLKGKNKNP